MPASEYRITREDILPIDDYAARRKQHRAELVVRKRNRRVEVGPFVTFYFENYDTMWSQIHEMLYIERGGEEQIEDELSAYNPLIPQGCELVATMMVEIPDQTRRTAALRQLTNIEQAAFVQIGEDKIHADPEHDVERTAPDGKTSSVHFLHFRFTPTQAARFKDPAVPALIGIEHENYMHMAGLTPAVRQALAEDLD